MTFVFVAIVLILVVLGVPLFVIVGTATALCFTLFTSDHQHLVDLLPIVQKMEHLLTQQPFLAIPLFMAAGAIMTAGGIAQRLIEVAKAGLGFLPGGLAIAAVVACMFFATISGSSPVTLIAVGSIMFPALIESKYPENFSLGLVTTAGSLGCLLPPALSIIIYYISITGTSAAVSPEDMFLAGAGPAILIVFFLSIYSVWIGLRKVASIRPQQKGRKKAVRDGAVALAWALALPIIMLGVLSGLFGKDKKRYRTAVREGMWALLLPVIVLGGIYGGFYTPSEAGGVAMVYALFVTVVIYRELNVQKLMRTLYEAAALMGSLILIILLTFGLNDFLAEIGIQDKIMNLVTSMNLGPFGFLLLVNVILIVLGALMDSISATLIFAPMLAPVAWELYRIDPVHFGIVFVVNMEIGYLMPPVATNLFVSAAVFKKPFGQVCRAVLPTLAITILALIAVMYVPTVSKAAVNLKHGKPMYEPFPWDGHHQRLAEEESGTAVGPAGGTEAGGPDLAGLTEAAMADWDEGEGEANDKSAADAGPTPDTPTPDAAHRKPESPER